MLRVGQALRRRRRLGRRGARHRPAAVAHNVIAQSRFEQKRYAESAAALRESLKFAPEILETHILLGEACQRAGDAAGARSAWNNASRLGGNTVVGKQARKRLAETGMAG